jgi:RNA polymerase sigma-70 factor (ECF subfamily)
VSRCKTTKPGNQVAVGTVKSRVNRARLKLAYLLDLTGEAELGPDDVTKTALAADQV